MFDENITDVCNETEHGNLRLKPNFCTKHFKVYQYCCKFQQPNMLVDCNVIYALRWSFLILKLGLRTNSLAIAGVCAVLLPTRR